VWYRGDRDADPEKDSLIWWEEPGGWTTAALEWIDGGGTCPGAREDVATSVWTLSRTPGNDVRLVRLFERGSYHLQGAALRYRRGAGGRQPLTPETLSRSGSGFALAGGGIVVWEVEVPDMGAPGKGAWRGVAGKVESGG
ncbi:MAG: hypothetical protein OEZ37_05670, partial [Gemmatimonadota bacterium]|nr:hypothetical protein [Gemmatimonadota bacterium]